jgi:hypothetical protein
MSTLEQKRLKVPYGSRLRHKADALQFVMSPRPKLAPLRWRHRQNSAQARVNFLERLRAWAQRVWTERIEWFRAGVECCV